MVPLLTPEYQGVIYIYQRVRWHPLNGLTREIVMCEYIQSYIEVMVNTLSLSLSDRDHLKSALTSGSAAPGIGKHYERISIIGRETFTHVVEGWMVEGHGVIT